MPINGNVIDFVLLISSSNMEEIKVFNNSKLHNYKLGFAAMVDLGQTVVWRAPINDMLWYPASTSVNSRLQYSFLAMLYHILPALLVDGLLQISGKQSR